MQIKYHKAIMKRIGAAALSAAVLLSFSTAAAETFPGFSSHAETEASAASDSVLSGSKSAGQSGISAGKYVPSSFTFSGGTGKVKITCDWVKIDDSGASAEIVFHSAYYTRMTVDGKEYVSDVDHTLGTSTFVVPVRINEPTDVSAVTTRMGAPHAIAYALNVGLNKRAKTYGSKNSGGSKSDKNEKTPPKKTSSSSKKYFKNGVLKNGTYRIQAWTDQYMFNIQPYQGGTYAILTVKNGKMKAKITLTGQGYDYLYPGTAAQAEKAAKSTWIRYSNHNNYYSYTIPVKTLNKKFQLAGHSKRRNRWYQHKAAFYTSGIVRVKGSATVIPKGKNTIKRRSTAEGTTVQKVFHNNHKKDRISKSTSDRSGSTSRVDSRAGRKDGVYTPSSFSWSGGSGRLKGISCSKITVTGGKAYATIVFDSPYYDQLRADGRTFMRSGSGGSTSVFVIPVHLNANNKVVGRTVAMSQPHWITYTLYVGLSGKGGNSSSARQLKSGQKKLSRKAPEIAGLKKQSSVKVEHAELFKIFRYSRGITLIQVDLEKYAAGRSADGNKKQKTKVESGREELEKKEGKTQSERTQQLYKGRIINYLVVPSGASVPAGLDKNCIVIHTPKHGYTDSQSALRFAGILNQSGRFSSFGFNSARAYRCLPASAEQDLRGRVKSGRVQFPGDWKHVDYRDLVEEKTDLCILPSGAVPREEGQLQGRGEAAQTKADRARAEQHPVKHFLASVIGILPDHLLPTSLRSFVHRYAPDSESTAAQGSATAVSQQNAGKQYAQLDNAIQLFTAMETPVLIDRSAREKGTLAQAEWVKVYGAVLGCEKEAENWFSSYARSQTR